RIHGAAKKHRHRRAIWWQPLVSRRPERNALHRLSRGGATVRYGAGARYPEQNGDRHDPGALFSRYRAGFESRESGGENWRVIAVSQTPALRWQTDPPAVPETHSPLCTCAQADAARQTRLIEATTSIAQNDAEHQRPRAFPKC